MIDPTVPDTPAPAPEPISPVSLRILVWSNASWAQTGYGVQARHLVSMFRALGCTVAEAPFYGLEGGVLTTDGVIQYPKGWSAWGDDIAPAHAQHFQADLVVGLLDSWVLDIDRFAGQRLVLYAPVDHEPIPPDIAERLRRCYLPVMYSQFAVRKAAEVGIATAYAPHCIDTRVYVPGDRDAARARLGWPTDRPILVTVAANKGYPSRKNWPQMIRAFAALRREHPDALWYCHTTSGEHGEYQGMNLPRIAERFGITVGTSFDQGASMVIPGNYQMLLGYPDDYMVACYQAADLFVLPSGGEGFGVPLLDALSCGTPILTTNVTAQQDFSRGGAPGWYLPEDKCEPFITPLYADQYIPQAQALADLLVAAVTDLRQDPQAQLARRVAARQFAEAYDIRHVALAHWQPILRHVAAEIAEGGRMAFVGQAQHQRDIDASRQIVAPADRYAFWLNRWSDIQAHLPFLYERARGVTLELGTRSGVSQAALLAGVAQHGGHLISVDLDAQSGGLPAHPQWTFLQADSRDQDAVAGALLAHGDGRIDLLFIDTEHTYDQVMAELALYAPLVRPGGQILLHDVRSFPPVLRAVETSLRQPERQHWTLHIHEGSNGLGVVTVPLEDRSAGDA